MGQGHVIGHETGLSFELDWTDAHPKGTAAEATRGTLRVRFAGEILWGEASGIEWTWIELLEHLGSSWPYLQWEEAPPIPVDAPIERLRASAEERWRCLSAHQREEEEEELWAFENAHDLAAGVQGITAPSLWLIRSGTLFEIISGGVRATQPAHQVLETLATLGEAIRGRLASLADERTKDAVERWERRDELAPLRRAAIVSGLSVDDLRELTGDDPTTILELEAEPEQNAPLAAARMAATRVPLAVVRRILDWILGLPQRSTETLDELVAFVESQAVETDEGIPAQAQAIAQSVRQWLDSPEGRLDPDAVLERLGVTVAEHDLGTRDLDAVATWGPKHGPAVLVNTAGRHAGGEPGRRATLAHEIGHLVWDRNRALPLTEVLGGRVSREVEARAKAFAAELLVPAVVAVRAFAEDADSEAVLERLTRAYGASRELVAWQVRNAAGADLAADHRRYLRRYVSEPDRF